MQIYVHKDDQQHGPFTDSEIIASLRNGTFTKNDLCWSEGSDGWVPIAQLFPALPAGPAPPPPVPAFTRAQKKQKVEFAGWGAAVQAIGLLLCFTLVGALIGIPLMIIGGRMSRKLICTHCGNQTTGEAKICSTCGAHFS